MDRRKDRQMNERKNRWTNGQTEPKSLGTSAWADVQYLTDFSIKRKYFGPFFGVQTFFPKYPALQQTTPYGFLISFQNLEKTNGPIPRQTDRQTEGNAYRSYLKESFGLLPGVQYYITKVYEEDQHV